MARCGLPEDRLAGDSFAESWEEFSAAADAEGSCSHGPAGRLRTSHSDVATTKSPDTLRAIRRFESFLVYCFGEAAGLAASFFAPFSALAGLDRKSVV